MKLRTVRAVRQLSIKQKYPQAERVPDVGRAGVVLEAPGLRVEDGLAVQVEPAAHLAEAFLEDGHYAPVRRGPHVEQHIPATRHNLNEVRDELLGQEDVRERHLAPVAPRLAVHRHARLPLVRQQVARRVAVVARVEVAVFAHHIKAPSESTIGVDCTDGSYYIGM